MKSKRIKNQSRVAVEVILNASEARDTFRHIQISPRNTILVPYFSISEQVLELARRKQITITDVN